MTSSKQHYAEISILCRFRIGTLELLCLSKCDTLVKAVCWGPEEKKMNVTVA